MRPGIWIRRSPGNRESIASMPSVLDERDQRKRGYFYISSADYGGEWE